MELTFKEHCERLNKALQNTKVDPDAILFIDDIVGWADDRLFCGNIPILHCTGVRSAYFDTMLNECLVVPIWKNEGVGGFDTDMLKETKRFYEGYDKEIEL
jgi:hypothetical protein